MCGDGKETFRPAISRPVIIAEDPLESPHPFLDRVLPQSNIRLSEDAIYFKAIREERP